MSMSEGAKGRTHGWPVREGRAGGEGGIRTHGAFAHRFSRAAPSTTRTPLRKRGYRKVRRGSAELGILRRRSSELPEHVGVRIRSDGQTDAQQLFCVFAQDAADDSQ